MVTQQHEVATADSSPWLQMPMTDAEEVLVHQTVTRVDGRGEFRFDLEIEREFDRATGRMNFVATVTRAVQISLGQGSRSILIRFPEGRGLNESAAMAAAIEAIDDWFSDNPQQSGTRATSRAW